MAYAVMEIGTMVGSISASAMAGYLADHGFAGELFRYKEAIDSNIDRILILKEDGRPLSTSLAS